jgi:hypothetical protein
MCPIEEHPSPAGAKDVSGTCVIGEARKETAIQNLYESVFNH